MTKFDSPFLELDFPLPSPINDWVKSRDYIKIDHYFKKLTDNGGELFNFLGKYCDFSEIEFILAVRTSPDDDGIWHDDGSRKMAFSLSLNLEPEKIVGGALYMRNRNTPLEEFAISPRKYGKILLFKTGLENFEHKVGEVQAGFRFVVAGWCS